MPTKTIIWSCGLCGASFDTEDAAAKCEASGIDTPKVKEGDIVFVHSGFGWADGDPHWISNPRALDPRPDRCKHNCFGSCCTYRFYYVVTKIDREGHRTRYHLFTKAMTKSSGYHSGFTFNSGHYPIKKAENVPDYVVKDSKDLIGRYTDQLLN